MTRYYEFPANSGSWVKETVDNSGSDDLLTRRQYTGDPRVKSANAKLDNITEFDAATEASATRWRQGFVMDGSFVWQEWEPV